MQAARIMEKGGRYKLCRVNKPDPGLGQMVIKVRAAGFCHTDILVSQAIYGHKFPITGSHEPAGEVVSLAPDVREQGIFKVGDRVAALNQVQACGKCYDCRNLDAAFCPKSVLAGVTGDGCFSEYFAVLASNAVKIPDSMPFEVAAALTCAGVTMYEAITKANLKPGQVLAISGLGALGHIGVQIARAKGLVTVGIDAADAPLALARELKLAPHITLDARESTADTGRDSIRRYLESSGGNNDRLEGADALICTSDPPSAVEYGLKLLARHGKFVLVSQPEEFSVPFFDIIFRNIKIIGSLQGNQRALQETIDIVNTAGIEVRLKAWQLKEVNDMWSAQHDAGHAGKSVVIM